MPTIGYTTSRRTGQDNIPREHAAENFRRMLLQLHRLWDPSFEIVFWRKRGRVLCEVQDSCSPIDKRRVLRVRRRALKMRHCPLKLMRTKRLALGLTVAEAADKAGLSRSYWNLIELGRRRMKIETLCRVAEVLDLEPGQLLRRTTQNVNRQKHCSTEISESNFQELARMQRDLALAQKSKV